MAASAPQTVATSQLLWNANESVSNTALVATDGNGSFQVYVSQSVDLIIDVQGYFLAGNGSPAPGGFVPLPNGGSRIVDTRSSTSVPTGRLAAGQTVTVSAETAADGVPSTASAVFANITVLSYDGISSYVTAWPTGSPRPGTSLDYVGNKTTALGAAVDINSNGQFSLYVGTSGQQPIDVLIDIEGYMPAARPPVGSPRTRPGCTTRGPPRGWRPDR